MTLVDSSVWIDYFNGRTSRETDMLDRSPREEHLAIGDLILAEVLQRFSSDREFREAHKMLSSLVIVDLGGKEVAVQAARNFRMLRKLGVTVRKTIGTIILRRGHRERLHPAFKRSGFRFFRPASWAPNLLILKNRTTQKPLHVSAAPNVRIS